MAYLLIRAEPSAAQAPGSRAGFTLNAGKFHLAVEPGTGLRVLESSSAPGRKSSPLWIVFQGYLQDASVPTRNGSTGTSVEDCLNEIETRLDRSGSVKSLDSLQGNFTLVLIDPDQDYVRIQCDVLGGRTAYWADTPALKAISNSSARIASLPGVSDELDPGWMACHFATPSTRPAGRSAFEDVHQLLPGEILEWQAGRISTRRNILKTSSGNRPQTELEWIEEFSNRFKRAVLDCVPAGRPPAIMLSGGLDSSPIAGVIASCDADLARATAATSWALADFPACDETHWIREIINHTGIQDATFEASNMVPFAELSREHVSSDTPYFNAFRPLINTCYKQAATREHEVILNGHAGDAIYPPLRLLLKEQLRSKNLAGAADTLASAVRNQGLFGIHRDPSLRGLFSFLKKLKPSSQRNPAPAWLSERARSALPDARSWPPEAGEYRWPDYAQQLLGQRIGSGTALEQAYCSPYGIERRDPFINEDLVRLMLSMPFSMSWRNGVSKWVMREAILRKKLLPEEIARKTKTGNLSKFFDIGFAANRNRLRSFLSERQQWQEWVEPEWVWRALGDNDTPNASAQLLVNQCIGYCLWLDKIKHRPKS